MRELGQIMLQDNGLNQITRYLLSTISFIQEQYHRLILMILLKAVIQRTDMEHTALALSLGLLVLTNHNIRWQFQLLSDNLLEIVKAF